MSACFFNPYPCLFKRCVRWQNWTRQLIEWICEVSLFILLIKVFILQLYHLFKISWRKIYFSGYPAYLTAVLNIDISNPFWTLWDVKNYYESFIVKKNRMSFIQWAHTGTSILPHYQLLKILDWSQIKCLHRDESVKQLVYLFRRFTMKFENNFTLTTIYFHINNNLF